MLDDAAAVAVVRKELKKRQDSVESFEKGGRPELAAKEKAEAAILSAYLPQPLTRTNSRRSSLQPSPMRAPLPRKRWDVS